MAPNLDGDTAPEPTQACLEARITPAQPGGQPWLIESFARGQQSRPSPPSKWRDRTLNHQAWGFNAIRLGVLWAGTFPARRGAADGAYMASVRQIVKICEAHGIHVVVDMHSDVRSQLVRSGATSVLQTTLLPYY